MEISALLSQYLSDNDNGKNKLIQLRQAITEALSDEQDYASTIPEWKPVRLLMRDDKVGGGYHGDSNKPIHDLSQCMAYIKEQNEKISDQVNAGFILVSSFEQGATLTLSNEVLLYEADGQYYRWTGDLPKVVDANSSPATTGGISGGAWVLIGDGAFRSELHLYDGLKFIGQCPDVGMLRAIEPTEDKQRIYVTGYYSGSSVGGGYFYYDKSDVITADDGGICFVTELGKRWKRDTNLITSFDFGVVPDIEVDQSKRLQLFFNSGGVLTGDSDNSFIYVTKEGLDSLPNYGIMPASGVTIIFDKTKILLEPNVDVRHVIAGNSKTHNITIVNAHIDGNNSACNGIGCAGVGNWNLISPTIENVKGNTFTELKTPLGGGRGITFQFNCKNIKIESPFLKNCDFGMDLIGTVSTPNHNIVVNNVVAEYCSVIIEAYGSSFSGRLLAENMVNFDSCGVVINGVSFKNCGLSSALRINSRWKRQNSKGNCLPWASPARIDTSYSDYDWLLLGEYTGLDNEWSSTKEYDVGDIVQVTNDGTYSALFAFAGASGISINNVRGRNDADYGMIGALFRGTPKGVQITNVSVMLDTQYIWRFGPTPQLNITDRPTSTAQNITVHNVVNLGKTLCVAESDTPIAVSYSYSIIGCELVDIKIHPDSNQTLLGSNLANSIYSSQNYIRIINSINGGVIEGIFTNLDKYSVSNATGSNAFGKRIMNGEMQIINYNASNVLRLSRVGDGDYSGEVDLQVRESGLNINKTLVLTDSAWNGSKLRLGAWRFWVDEAGNLRKKNSDPLFASDGVVVG